ncbi:MAG: hypothetical protein Q8P67_28410 [archaeon]|nr:hypothetical protein [archaeon]
MGACPCRFLVDGDASPCSAAPSIRHQCSSHRPESLVSRLAAEPRAKLQRILAVFEQF